MWSPELLQLQGHDSHVLSVAFSPDGGKIISGSSDRTIRIWDATIGVEMLPPLRGHDDWIRSVADGSKIISGSDDMTIRVWDASTGIETLPPLRGHDMVTSVAFSPDGSKIVSGSDDETIRVWDAGTGIALSHPQMQADDSPRPAMDEQTIGWWLINVNTGRYMGALPVGAGLRSAKLHGSTYVGWTSEYKLVLVHFPEL